MNTRTYLKRKPLSSSGTRNCQESDEMSVVSPEGGGRRETGEKKGKKGMCR